MDRAEKLVLALHALHVAASLAALAGLSRNWLLAPIGVDTVFILAAYRAEGRLPERSEDLLAGGLEMLRWCWGAVYWLRWWRAWAIIQLADSTPWWEPDGPYWDLEGPHWDNRATSGGSPVPLRPPLRLPQSFVNKFRGGPRRETVREIRVDSTVVAAADRIAATWLYRENFAPEWADWLRCARLTPSGKIPVHTIRFEGCAIQVTILPDKTRKYRITLSEPGSVGQSFERTCPETAGIGFTPSELICEALTAISD